MAMPPTDVEPSELFVKLTSEVRPSEVVDFPRKNAKGEPVGKVRIQVLNMEDHDQARLDAERWLMKEKGVAKGDLNNPASQEVLGDRIAREVLAKACVSEEPIPGSENAKNGPFYARVFGSPDDLGLLRPDELNTLFTMYKMVQRKWGPYEGNLDSEEQVTAWERKLVEGASAVPLGRLDWHQLVELSSSLAERSYTLSAILASQLSTLPDSLAARLSSWGIGTTSRGVLPASATSIGLTREDLGISETEGKTDPEDVEAILNLAGRDPITLEEAAALSEQLHSLGGRDV